MAQTLTQLQNDVLSRLNLASTSHRGDLDSGTSTTPTITTTATITQYLNEAAAVLATTCYPIKDTGTYAWAANTKSVLLTGLTVSSSQTLWLATDVKYTVDLQGPVSIAALKQYHPDYLTPSATAPANWYVQGDGIGIYPVPSAGPVTITVQGYAIPAALAGSGTAAAWLRPDLEKLMVFYAAWMIAFKNSSDNFLEEYGVKWNAEWLKGCMALWAKLTDYDRNMIYKVPPVPLGK
jgi:hypothetical protein